MLRKLLPLAALLASACGNFCDHLESVQRTRGQKDVDCNNGTVVIVYNRMRCEEGLRNCTSTDQSKLNDWIGCVDRVPPCKRGERDVYNAEMTICNAKLKDVSTGCALALSGF
jgi:hypothetical protein